MVAACADVAAKNSVVASAVAYFMHRSFHARRNADGGLDKSSQSELGRRVAAALSKPNHSEVCGDQPRQSRAHHGTGRQDALYGRASSFDVCLIFSSSLRLQWLKVTTENHTISTELFNQIE